MYLLLIFAIPEFMNEWKLYLILGIQVLFTITLSGEWIYEGMENQKYITYRTFFTSLLLVLAIFFFINSSADYLKYVFFLSVINIISSIFNFFYLKKHIKVKHIAFKELSVTKHLRFVLIIFAAQITAIIYTQSAITIIGIFDNMESVGYYSMATKFFRLSTVLWSAFSGSLIPKLTYLWTCKDSEKYEIYANNIYSLIVLVSVFIGLMVFSLSEPIIICFAGEAFNESILTLRILSFGIFGSALAYFFGIILLYSQKNERKFLYASIFVAILNTLLNLIAIKFANYNAVAFITVISEYICFLYLVIRFKCNYKGIKILSNNTIKCLMAGITAGYITLLSINYTSNAIMQIIVGFLVGTIAYSMLLMLLKHVYLKSILLQLHKQFIR